MFAEDLDTFVLGKSFLAPLLRPSKFELTTPACLIFQATGTSTPIPIETRCVLAILGVSCSQQPDDNRILKAMDCVL